MEMKQRDPTACATFLGPHLLVAEPLKDVILDNFLKRETKNYT